MPGHQPNGQEVKYAEADLGTGQIVRQADDTEEHQARQSQQHFFRSRFRPGAAEIRRGLLHEEALDPFQPDQWLGNYLTHSRRSSLSDSEPDAAYFLRVTR